MADAKQKGVGPSKVRRLSSWKEIAAYLGRTVRTVQRWERTEDLPVHRHRHRQGDSIFAYSSEIDTWAARRLRTPLCPAPPADTPLKIAVLPFDMPDTEERDELGAQIAESLISRFTRIGNLQVVSSESVLRLKHEGAGPSESARRLGVSYVIGGNVRRDGDQVRLRVTLLRAADSVYVWSKQFDAPAEDVSALEQRIAESITQETRVALSPRDRWALPGTSIPAAYQAFIKGRHATRQFSYFRQEVYSVEARRFLARSLELDPDYAEALAEVGYLEYLLWETSGDAKRLAASDTALRASLKLDPANPEAHYIAGRNAIMALDSDRALEHARLALRYAPNACRPNLTLAGALWAKGLWEEAERASRRAIGADPLYLCCYTDNANLLALLGRYQEALKRAKEALHVEPGGVAALNALAAPYILQGDLESASRVFRSGLEKSPLWEHEIFELGIAFLDAAGGRIVQARRVREQFAETPSALSVFGMHLYAFLCSLCGEGEEAVKIFDSHPYLGNYRSLISLWPLWPLRGSPSFRRLIEDRYERWRRDVSAIGPQLRDRPPRLADPIQFLRLTLNCPGDVDGAVGSFNR